MGIQTSTINNGPTAGFKNAIINGNFDFWQRGTTSSNAVYLADRWRSDRTATTYTISRQAFTVGQSDVPNNPAYFARNVIVSVAGAGNFYTYRQFIEDATTFAGQQITVSYWAKADAAKPIAIEIQQEFDTVNGGSPAVNTFVAKPTLTTSWVRYSHTITVPSVSGKTVAADNALGIIFWLDAGSNFNSRTNSLGQQSGTFDIAQVQVEEGPVATDFERRDVGTELALCQRYYFNTATAGTSTAITNAYVNTTTSAAGVIPFPVKMRVPPTGFGQSGTAADYQVRYLGSSTNCTSVPVSTLETNNAAVITFTTGAVLTAGQGCIFRSTNSNGNLAWSAEL